MFLVLIFKKQPFYNNYFAKLIKSTSNFDTTQIHHAITENR